MALQFTFTCPLAAGLHARPASLLAETAQKTASECTLINLRTGVSANLKSTLAIIGADVRKGDSCRVVCEGTGEASAYTLLRQVIEQQLAIADNAVAAATAAGTQLPRALRDAGCTFLPGTGVSPGIGIGAVVYAGQAAWPVVQQSHPFV